MGWDYSTPTFGNHPIRMAKEMREMFGVGEILVADLEATEGGKEYRRFPTFVCGEECGKGFPGVLEPAVNSVPEDPRVVPQNFQFACDNNHQRMFVRFDGQVHMDNKKKKGSFSWSVIDLPPEEARRRAWEYWKKATE